MCRIEEGHRSVFLVTLIRPDDQSVPNLILTLSAYRVVFPFPHMQPSAIGVVCLRKHTHQHPFSEDSSLSLFPFLESVYRLRLLHVEDLRRRDLCQKRRVAHGSMQKPLRLDLHHKEETLRSEQA